MARSDCCYHVCVFLLDSGTRSQCVFHVDTLEECISIRNLKERVELPGEWVYRFPCQVEKRHISWRSCTMAKRFASDTAIMMTFYYTTIANDDATGANVCKECAHRMDARHTSRKLLRSSGHGTCYGLTDDLLFAARSGCVRVRFS